ncbi:hypothetical protein [Rhodococcus gannanensis]|uniref:Peptidoglycan binding-like domain-containing protein n=1 Tax=Rhodococcus gannanensis TaxID=1960308 RepID=A0ABW4P800_9NOCA
MNRTTHPGTVATPRRDDDASPADPNRFPLPPGHYWGPLDGPAESWSNYSFGTARSSVDGLSRWQRALGLPDSGIYDHATRTAAFRMQWAFGWPVSGNVSESEWEEVVRQGWRLPPISIDPGPEAPRPRRAVRRTRVRPGLVPAGGGCAPRFG